MVPIKTSALRARGSRPLQLAIHAGVLEGRYFASTSSALPGIVKMMRCFPAPSEMRSGDPMDVINAVSWTTDGREPSVNRVYPLASTMGYRFEKPRTAKTWNGVSGFGRPQS
jgi:hypothetical protein